METTTERTLARVRRYFELHPKALTEACERVNIPYSTAKDALKPERNPRTDTLSALERAVPVDFESEASNA